MKREDVEKLLGGYATGTLSEQERRALFEAALTDQALFDSLVNEEALAEVLNDPRCRRQLAATLEERPPLAVRLTNWLRGPQAWVLAGSTAAVLIVAVAVIRLGVPVARHETQIALVKEKAAAPAPAPPAAAAPVRETLGAPSKPAEIKRRFEPPRILAERRAEVPAPRELGALAGPPAPPPAVAASATAPPPAAPKQAQDVEMAAGRVSALNARDMFLNQSAQQAPQAAPQAMYRAGGPAAQQAVIQTGKSQQDAGGIGLRYRVLAAGDRVRLSVEATRSGYVYILGSRGVLSSAPVMGGRPYVFTIGGAEPTVWILLSRRPDTGPRDSLLQRNSTPLNTAPLLVEHADNATYIMNASNAPDAGVLAEVQLRK